jgi:hypothetical protein
VNYDPEFDVLRQIDRQSYHPDNPADYRSVVGIEGPDGNFYCVGCFWCDPPQSLEDQRRAARRFKRPLEGAA